MIDDEQGEAFVRHQGWGEGSDTGTAGSGKDNTILRTTVLPFRGRLDPVFALTKTRLAILPLAQQGLDTYMDTITL
jgi:hypothetical protein